jgi:hypothetical protein
MPECLTLVDLEWAKNFFGKKGFGLAALLQQFG